MEPEQPEQSEIVSAYPIGIHQPPDRFDAGLIRDWIETLENFPRWLDVLIENLDEEQLHVPYRPEGWSTQQIIHHLADSHLMAYTRLKLALTEDEPVIKPYEQNLWAETPEVDVVPVNVSITLLHALHRRMGALLRTMEDQDWARTFFHPEQERAIPLWEFIDYYAWHARHHTEQIRKLRERKGWGWAHYSTT